jgi:hypothetical protein
MKRAQTVDKKINAYGIMDTAAVYFLDTAYGPKMVSASRKQKGQVLPVEMQLPEGFVKYNEMMGGVDGIDRHRMGDHGCEGRGRALKWTARMHDADFNIADQASFCTYSYCREQKWGNLPTLSHCQFNESLMTDLMYNVEWQAEKDLAATGKRRSLRGLESSIKKARLAAESSGITFHQFHDLEKETEKDKRGTAKRGPCVNCPAHGTGSKDNTRLSSFFCKQCSIIAPNGKVYIHPECFGEYHRNKLAETGGGHQMAGVNLFD